MNTDYTYTKQDILKDFGLKAGTFYNRIKELGIMDNDMYMIKTKENNRAKTYFNQRAYDKIREYQEGIKTSEKVSTEHINEVSDIDTVPLYLHEEIVKLLKQQLEEKDKQIERLQNIIGVKEQTTLVEKQKMLGTKEHNQNWFTRIFNFNKKNKEDPVNE